MRQMRFFPGLVGFLCGVLVGAFLGAYLVTSWPSPPTDRPAALSPEADQLRQRLEASERQKEDLNRQMGQFREIAERMTASFNDLERRFNALAAQLRQDQGSAGSAITPAAGLAATPPAGR